MENRRKIIGIACNGIIKRECRPHIPTPKGAAVLKPIAFKISRRGPRDTRISRENNNGST
jgi:hypothetical protein